MTSFARTTRELRANSVRELVRTAYEQRANSYKQRVRTRTNNEPGISYQSTHDERMWPRAVELKLHSLNFPSYSAFVPTAEDMKLSPRAFHRKMCSGQEVEEVAGHAGFYVMVQYSVSQLCNELQKLESWSAADP